MNSQGLRPIGPIIQSLVTAAAKDREATRKAHEAAAEFHEAMHRALYYEREIEDHRRAYPEADSSDTLLGEYQKAYGESVRDAGAALLKMPVEWADILGQKVTTSVPLTASAHDPVARQMAGEPRLALMARDWRAPGLCRIYADVRELKWGHAHKILEAMERQAAGHQRQPHKDASHAWSARRVADEMEQWFMSKHRPAGAINRVNGAPVERPDAFAQVPTHAQLKAARPPAEPEEGQ